MLVRLVGILALYILHVQSAQSVQSVQSVHNSESLELINTSVGDLIQLTDISLTDYTKTPQVFTDNAAIITDSIENVNNNEDHKDGKIGLNLNYDRYHNHNSTVLVKYDKIVKISYLSIDKFVEIINDGEGCRSIRREYKLGPAETAAKNLRQLQPQLVKNNDGVYEFFPDCYPGDGGNNVLKISVATDYGVFLALGSNQLVIDEIENLVSVIRLVYTRQTHVRIDVDRLHIGNKNSPKPLGRNKLDGSCASALTAFDEMSDWTKSINVSSNYWMEVSDCFSGVIGVSWIGGVCSSWSNYGVSARNWLTFAHELGHGFGCSHTFDGGKGGIMDYGDGKYDGVYQFSPKNRDEFCGYVTSLKTNNQNCVVQTSSSCGDGVMGPDEQCECITRGLKKCGLCVGCKLTKKIQCAPSVNFIMRYTTSQDYVSTNDKSIYTNVKCCVNNKFKGPKTLCSNKGACGFNGVCNNVCEPISYDSKACGFFAKGCQLGCTYNKKCHPIALPDMTSCTFSNNKNGRCINEICVLV